MGDPGKSETLATAADATIWRFCKPLMTERGKVCQVSSWR
jgi:hypothetical protein